MLGLKPIERLYLLVALAIVAQQLIVLDGHFDPIAFAAIAFFIGLIPAGRADKGKKGDDDPQPPSAKLGSTIRGVLDRSKEDEA